MKRQTRASKRAEEAAEFNAANVSMEDLKSQNGHTTAATHEPRAETLPYRFFNRILMPLVLMFWSPNMVIVFWCVMCFVLYPDDIYLSQMYYVLSYII